MYLITGGVGGLGFIFAEFLARQAQARLVLTGRSALSLDKQRKVKELEQLGAEVTYIQADISSQEAVGELISKIKSRFSEINGVIHSAGILRDGFVFNKKLEEMQEVLAPKVHGTVWLDKATQQEPLDFFVLFSSVAAISGNIGQSDYAYSNSFMDYYATWRSEQENRGKTLSINWPLWKEGGMTVGEEKASFLKVLGMEPMSTENGINTFVAGLKQSAPQLIVAQEM
ncbi:SDR family NAD(P)-dependent oxidoreductase [Priestia megaterium]